MQIGPSVQFGFFKKWGWGSSPGGIKDHTPMPDSAAIQVRKGSLTMKRWQVLPLLFGLFFAFTGGVVNAQTTGDSASAAPSREQVKKERDDFFKSHRYDAASENWVLKPGFEPPTGPMSRAEVKAERDAFFKTHQYDAVSETWVPVKGEPRDLSKLTRAQVRTETMQFYRTHEWDDVTSTWVAKKPRSTKPTKK